MVDVLTAPG